MNDNALIAVVATQIEAAMTAAGWGYVVIQKNDPTQEGAPSGPAVFFEKLFDHPYGWPMSKAVQNAPLTLSETTTQLYETTFQISALVKQDPQNLFLPTASDVANYVKIFISTPTIIRAMAAQGVATLRVTEVRNPYFEDDHSQFEANPSFDIVVTSNRSISLTIPGVISASGNLIVT